MAKVPPSAISNVKNVVHTHPLPVCKGGAHNKTCRRHGPEVSCIKVRYLDPAGKTHEFAVCTHLFK